MDNILVSLLREFSEFKDKRYSASSRRVYLSAAKKALRILGEPARQCQSCEELLSLLTERKEKGEISGSLRLNPFLVFVRSKTRTNAFEDANLEAIRTWIVTSVLHETKTATGTSYLIRRDLAMLAGLCLAPEKRSPRFWPMKALTVTKLRDGGFKVALWGCEFGNQGLALPLLYWHFWRERLARPDQARLQRKESWAFSDLLFPNADGNTLQSQVVRNALKRMNARNKGPADVTPALIRRAFLQISADARNEIQITPRGGELSLG
jgi:hypothetical protein